MCSTAGGYPAHPGGAQHGHPDIGPDDQLRGLTVDELRDEVVNLRRALASNRQIGAAVGVAMHERGLGYDEAFAVLRKASQDSNVPLAQVAAAVLQLGRLTA